MKFTIEYKNQKGGAEKNNNNVYYILCNDNECEKITEDTKNNYIKNLKKLNTAIDIININFHLEIATQWDEGGDTYYPLINEKEVEHFEKIPELNRKNLVKSLEKIKKRIKEDNPGLVFSDENKLKKIDSLINFLNGTISRLNLIAVQSSQIFKEEPYYSIGLNNIPYKVKKE